MNEYLSRIQALPADRRRVLSQKLHEWIASHGGDRGAMRALALFYVAKDDLSSEDVRTFLQARLPDHLVPGEFVAVEKLPRTVNGKIDRPALQRLHPSPRPGAASATPSPMTGTEQQMAAIWCRVLNVAAVRADDNFFALGGHSLLATQVIMQIETQFGVEMPLGAIFKHPTVAQLCRHLETRTRSAPAVPGSRELEAERGQDVALSTAQRRMWYASQQADAGLSYKIVKVLELRGALNVAALQQALGEVVRRHETLRTCFVYAAGELVQHVASTASPAIEYVDLTGLASAEAESTYHIIQARLLARPFNLERGPLMRTTLVRDSDVHARVIFDVHHIVVDGVSFGILVQELNSLFRAFAAGTPGALAPLPAQYRDFVAWEQQRVTPAMLEAQLGYWRRTLAGVPRLEFERPRLGTSASTSDGEIEFLLDPETSAQLTKACIGLQTTPFIVLASVYHMLLGMHTQARDIAIGTDVANRDSGAYAGLIGFFVNQVVLRIAATPDMTFRQLCARTRASVEEAFSNKDLPYDAVVHALKPASADRGRDPLFRAMFSLHHQLPDLALQDIETRFLDVKGRSAKYDLLLNMELGREGWQGSVEYNGSLFDREAIEQMAGHFLALCADAVRDVDAPIETLCRTAMAAAQERRRRDLDRVRADRRKDLRQVLAAHTASS